MPNRAFEAETNNEYRLMALLALTSQELPRASNSDVRWQEVVAKPQHGDAQSVYEQLDSDPAALEAFLHAELKRIRSSRRATPVSIAARIAHWVRESLAPPARLATALGVVAVVSILVWQYSGRDALSQKVEQSFAAYSGTTASALVLPWEQPRGTLGFATAGGNESRGAIAFAQGLMRGKDRLNPIRIARDQTAERASPANYFALGEWNALLWAASRSEQPMPVEFWSTQAALAAEFTAKSYAGDEKAAILSHLNNVRGLLEPLTKGENSLRTQRLLADELLSFRERFAPHTAASLDSH